MNNNCRYGNLDLNGNVLPYSNTISKKCQGCELYDSCLDDYDADDCLMEDVKWKEMSWYRYVEVTLEFKHSEL